MNWTEIPLIDYIDIEDEECTLHIHTKDKRIIGVRDVRSNGHLDDTGFYVDYHLGFRMSVFVPREDFSHIEYRYSPRQKITKKDFDDLYSYLDEDVDYEYPSESLTDPDEHLFDDLI